MSASEQEIKSQVAEMRQALRSARTSMRAGRLVGIFGVLAGLCIVGLFVYLFISLGMRAADRKAIEPILRRHVEALQIRSSLEQIVRDVGPVYLDEAGKMLKGMDLQGVAVTQAQEFMKDMEPVLREQLERVRPRLEGLIEAQRTRTMADLEDLLRNKLTGRLTQLVGEQGARLGTETKLDEDTLTKIIQNMLDASTGALQKSVTSRWGDMEGEMKKIGNLVLDLPALPEQNQEQLLVQIRDVLLNLVKYQLPDVRFAPGDFPSAPAADLTAPGAELPAAPAPPPPDLTPEAEQARAKVRAEMEAKAAEAERKAAVEAAAKAAADAEAARRTPPAATEEAR
jgi:hypothetical protein